MLIQLPKNSNTSTELNEGTFVIAAINAWKSGGNDQISRRHSVLL